jgi:hypothetical protein
MELRSARDRREEILHRGSQAGKGSKDIKHGKLHPKNLAVVFWLISNTPLGALGGFSLGAQWIVLSISSDLLLKLVRPHLIATRDN